MYEKSVLVLSSMFVGISSSMLIKDWASMTWRSSLRCSDWSSS